jgi:predicted nucleic-acid-binding Zn-ribbon protein/DNA polymerase elongation subunit (family B)
MSKLPKIILLDIETLPQLTATFSLYPESIPHDSIVLDWSVVCACWKELDRKTIYSVSVLDDEKRFKTDLKDGFINDDFAVVSKLREVFAEADILIGHNLKKFDYKKVNARLIFHGLEPLPKVHQLDTLTEARKIAAFTSNRLDYISKHLTGAGKLPTEKGLWLKSLTGDRKAIRDMVTYNKQDVKILEDVYLKLRPHMTPQHPHVGVLFGHDKEHSCPKCGSHEMVNHRIKFTAAGVKKLQKQCKQCHAYSTFIYKAEDVV